MRCIYYIMENKNNLLTIYRNYLFAIEERLLYGEKYGDTNEMMEIYEKKLENILNKKILKKDNYHKS